MSKTIIFCADGTWQGAATGDAPNSEETPSNVYKFFASLSGATAAALHPPREEIELEQRNADGDLLQCAKYINGVGDSSNRLVQILSGGTGLGIVGRIVRGYTFVSRNFVPGDRIILIGFSRGAYTVRALAGLISAKGLLDPTRIPMTDDEGKEDARRLGAAMWYSWRKAKFKFDRGMLQRLISFALHAPRFLSTRPTDKVIFPEAIEAIGVWDTVGALGIPEIDFDDDTPRDLFEFADTNLSAPVRKGYHAIAVDEERTLFPPTLWSPDARVEQSLWPGSHSDVGGGYPMSAGESSLSDASLAWMRERLAQHGVHFASAPRFSETPAANGVAHQSWRGHLGKVGRARRSFNAADSLVLSQTILERMSAGPVRPHPNENPADYAPDNLP